MSCIAAPSRLRANLYWTPRLYPRLCPLRNPDAPARAPCGFGTTYAVNRSSAGPTSGTADAREEPTMNASPPVTNERTHYELSFRSISNEGRGYAFPCDAAGHVNIDALTD